MNHSLCRIIWLMSCTWLLATGQTAAMMLAETDNPRNCTICHSDRMMLSEKHIKTTEKTDCFQCHDSEQQSLVGRLSLGHLHLFRDVGCTDCHGAKPFVRVDSAGCLNCHDSFRTVAENTADLTRNPHASPHYGDEVDCDICHHMHAKSENMCRQCHEWKTPVP